MKEFEEDSQLLEIVNGDVKTELERQRRLYGIQKHEDLKWLPILLEEVGEVAEALQKNTKAAKETDASDLYAELIQVAAVASSWAARLKAVD